jgi:GNAT superfamily N-acetyltransferase
VLKHEAPERIAQGIANHPVGVILLARLAVDKSEHGKGIGKALLRDALTRISQAADLVGVRAVLVHAIDDAARDFYLAPRIPTVPCRSNGVDDADEGFASFDLKSRLRSRPARFFETLQSLGTTPVVAVS